jgi:Icc-related predicted phosphoesterase
MRIVAASDLHGQLPPVADVPRGDVLTLAGDLCPDGDPAYQLNWIRTRFAAWVEQLPMTHVVATWGNHDWVGLEVPAPAVANVSWLCDSGVEIDGCRFWGSPWSLPFFDWAFMRPEADLARAWELMWNDADVVVVHCPPHGYGDRTRDGHNAGSSSLRERLETVQPQLVLFGHIHEAFGQWGVAGGTWANVSLVNFHCRLVRPAQVFTILGPAER